MVVTGPAHGEAPGGDRGEGMLRRDCSLLVLLHTQGTPPHPVVPLLLRRARCSLLLVPSCCQRHLAQLLRQLCCHLARGNRGVVQTLALEECSLRGGEGRARVRGGEIVASVAI